MFEHVNPKNDQPAPLISKEVFDIIMEVCGSLRITPGRHNMEPTAQGPSAAL
jgi:hypothetical protein